MPEGREGVGVARGKIRNSGPLARECFPTFSRGTRSGKRPVVKTPGGGEQVKGKKFGYASESRSLRRGGRETAIALSALLKSFQDDHGVFPVREGEKTRPLLRRELGRVKVEIEDCHVLRCVRGEKIGT